MFYKDSSWSRPAFDPSCIHCDQMPSCNGRCRWMTETTNWTQPKVARIWKRSSLSLASASLLRQSSRGWKASGILLVLGGQTRVWIYRDYPSQNLMPRTTATVSSSLLFRHFLGWTSEPSNRTAFKEVSKERRPSPCLMNFQYYGN